MIWSKIGWMDIDQLVQPERVHRRVYNDPDIFERELEKIFPVTWLFVGHVSQVPNPGNFFCTDIARQPVVMARHNDGAVKVLFNRCGHRDAQVVSPESGSTETFRCCYHDWEYAMDGKLLAVPQPRGYEEAR